MIIYLIIGFLLATIGMTILNCLGDLIVSVTDLIKAYIGIKIIKCNKAIEDKEEKIGPIGFDTTFKEDENNE